MDYELTSTVPSTLDEYIVYSADEDSDNTNVIPQGDVKTYVVTDEDSNTVYDNEGNEVTATYTYTLTFHDVLDSKLTLNDDLKVYIGGELLENTEEATYYTVTKFTDDGCTFEVSMDLLALYAAGIITEDDFGTTSITVTYSATLSDDAGAGAYTNTAWVSYLDTESEKDIVEVDVYGLKIFKYDQSDSTTDDEGNVTYTGLEGATFELYADEDCTELVATLTSGTDGYVTYEGLDAGTYYLKETEAPEGYVKADTVLTVIIPDDVDAETFLVSVNFANAPIPSTGGAGTTMYTVAGVCIVLIAGAALVVTRKNRREE
ncbi:MAG: isopeptide-forming domain-containing fimbrial protein [Clostridiales bacterium]|nr:isopeptide-forming domain-containing fimbrial protein [Clostridiales bacterium]